MSRNSGRDALRRQMMNRRTELQLRLARVHDNIGRPLDADSVERAQQLEDADVVDRLGNDAIEEIRRIDQALERLNDGSYGTCRHCQADIGPERLQAWPYATHCIDCAKDEERSPCRAG